MQIIDLFSGIGGFSLAGHWAGWQTVQFCEIDTFCGRVLEKNFPGIPIHQDIKTLTRDNILENGIWRPSEPTIVVGGFPCQPYSHAGRRKGNDDDRALWPQMLRIVREVEPAWVVGENVAGLLSMDGGRVFDGIVTDLENAGYSVEVFVIPACAVGAPHRRDRVWIVASNSDCIGGRGRNDENFEGQERTLQTERSDWNASDPYGVNSDISGFDSAETSQQQTNEVLWDRDWYEAASELCRVDDGVSNRVDKGRRLKALGNAIVPQIAKIIFDAIIHEHHNPHTIQ